MRDYDHLIMLYNAAQEVIANRESRKLANAVRELSACLESITDDWDKEESEAEESE